MTVTGMVHKIYNQIDCVYLNKVVFCSLKAGVHCFDFVNEFSVFGGNLKQRGISSSGNEFIVGEVDKTYSVDPNECHKPKKV